MNINEVLKKDEYKFIDEFKDRIMFLTFGGSHAYGTNIPTSDIDIRGVMLNNKSDLLGMSNFEQFINNETDTTIYSFNKIISLLLNCNPNTIELLFCEPEHYTYVSELGRELLDKRKLFLSQKAINSFGGYANQQLRRLQNALARDNYPQNEKEIHILNSCKSAMNSFNDRYEMFDKGLMNIFIDKALENHEDLETEMFINCSLQKYPLRDFKNILSEFSEILKNYNKINHRNNKKDDLHLNKHAMHLIRLYLMCLDILEYNDVKTYRKNDLDLLMSIRNGYYQKEDGTYIPEFFEMIDDFEKKIKYAKENTTLPKTPNYKEIEKFQMYINEKIVLAK